MLTFSVIIPVYNVENYLRGCVDSVLAQSCKDYEIILVDDGSTDSSSLICDEYGSAYADVCKVIHQQNTGLGGARNTGVQNAVGDYIVFLDSDDAVSPDMLATLKKSIREFSADMYIFDMQVVREDKSVIETVKENYPLNRIFTLEKFPSLLLGSPVACNKVYRRSFYLSSGIFFPHRFWYEDIRTIPKLYLLAESVVYIDKPFYKYLRRSGSITQNKNIDRNAEIIDALDDLYGFYRQNNAFEKYFAELEFLAVSHIFLAASVRVLKADAHHKLLSEFYEYMQNNFPDFTQNKYLATLGSAKTLAYRLLLKKRYRTVRLLFKIKDRTA